MSLILPFPVRQWHADQTRAIHAAAFPCNPRRHFGIGGNLDRLSVWLLAWLFTSVIALSPCKLAHSQEASADAVAAQELHVAFSQTDPNLAPAPTDGIGGPAWTFNGRDQFLTMAVANKPQLFDAMSLAVWIKLDNVNGPATHTILSWKDRRGSEARLFVVRPELKGRNYRLGFAYDRSTVLTDDPNHLEKQITPTLTSDMWYHLGLRVGEGKIVFYVDGVAVHKEAFETTSPLKFSRARLGIDQSGNAAFAGAMESIDLSPVVWTAEQMASLFRRDLGDTRLSANREQLLADFPKARSQLVDTNSKWSKALEPPYWYSKAWNWRPLQPSSESTYDSVTVIAAFDSPDKKDANFVCDGTVDDIDIQKALDAVPRTGGKVVLREGTYRLSNALLPKSATELEINGMLRVDDAVSSKLTKDAKSGDKTYHVADSNRFRVGQWVTAVDDNGTDHKGGWENWQGGRKYGECAVIAAIDGATITVRDVPDEYQGRSNWDGTSRYSKPYVVDAHAFLTTCHSAILVQGQSRVYIHGAGSICGNRMNQLRTAPTSNWRGWEEMRANSGIVVFDSSFVRIENLTIYDGNLHNVTFWMAENCTAEGLNVFGANDKNIAAVSTNRLRLLDNHAHDSVCEDGIIFYVLGHSALVGKNRLIDNPRYALRLHGSCRFATTLENVASTKQTDR